jgi:hypothetical protein
MGTRDALVSTLNALFDYAGPPLEKSAELAFMDRLTRSHTDEDLFGPKFVKVAELQGENPWVLAYRVAFSYPGLEKAASAGMPLARFYVGWADDLVKLAAAPAFVTKMVGWGKKLIGRGGQKATQQASAHAGGMAPASEYATAAQNFAKIKRSPQDLGVSAASRPGAVNPGNPATGQGGSTIGPKQIMEQRRANIKAGVPGAQAPAAPAKQGVNWGNVGYGAAGTAAVAGTGYLGYKGYQALKGGGAPQYPAGYGGY